MTPLEIEIAIHYACSARDYRNGDLSAPAVGEALDFFVRIGLLERKGLEQIQLYVPTEGLKVYVNALCQVPLPTLRWVMP